MRSAAQTRAGPMAGKYCSYGMSCVPFYSSIYSHDSGLPHELDPRTLETYGESTVGGQLETPVLAAHYRVVTRPGDTMNGAAGDAVAPQRDWVAFSANTGLSGTELIFYEFAEAGGKLRHAPVRAPLPGTPMALVHDIAVTEDYYVVHVGPLEFSPGEREARSARALFGGRGRRRAPRARRRARCPAPRVALGRCPLEHVTPNPHPPLPGPPLPGPLTRRQVCDRVLHLALRHRRVPALQPIKASQDLARAAPGRQGRCAARARCGPASCRRCARGRSRQQFCATQQHRLSLPVAAWHPRTRSRTHAPHARARSRLCAPGDRGARHVCVPPRKRVPDHHAGRAAAAHAVSGDHSRLGTPRATRARRYVHADERWQASPLPQTLVFCPLPCTAVWGPPHKRRLTTSVIFHSFPSFLPPSDTVAWDSISFEYNQYTLNPAYYKGARRGTPSLTGGVTGQTRVKRRSNAGPTRANLPCPHTRPLRATSHPWLPGSRRRPLTLAYARTPLRTPFRFHRRRRAQPAAAHRAGPGRGPRGGRPPAAAALRRVPLRRAGRQRESAPPCVCVRRHCGRRHLLGARAGACGTRALLLRFLGFGLSYLHMVRRHGGR